MLVRCLSFSIGVLMSMTAYGEGITYEISIQNLTKGQPLTPPVIAAHSPKTALFSLGEAASAGLGELAKDGATDRLSAELRQNYLVKRFTIGDGLILPGQTATLELEANDPRYQFSLVAMLARTNDAFMGVKGISTNFEINEVREYDGIVYDGGVELNTELCSDIPAPPCNNPGSGPTEGEGFVHPHPGIQNIGDLDPLRDAFATKVAKVVVKRIR